MLGFLSKKSVKRYNVKNPSPYIDRDISWLSFNYRVLQEAKDPNVPLLERIKFLAIYSSNLDEFFRVRVANHKNLVRAGKKTYKKLSFEPRQILKEILNIVNEQQEEFSQIIHNQLIPALKKKGIHILRFKELNDEQKQFSDAFFEDNLLPYIQPILLKEDKIKPFLLNGALYLAVLMRDKDENKKSFYYALVRIPTEHTSRFLMLPSKKQGEKELIYIDDVVRENIKDIFPGFQIIGSYSIKLTRDAELYIDDEYSGDLIEKIKKSLKKRNVGPASRLIYDREMPQHFVEYLKNVFDLKAIDIVREGRYHNNSDLMSFPDFGKKSLKDDDLPLIKYQTLESSSNIFSEIKDRDHLLFYPYHSYYSVVKFFQQAANDPKVTHIQVLQYRVAKKSKIMDALIFAVKNGKNVTVFIEVKARFDEVANLAWGEKLEAAGVKVLYSMPGLKVHSKMAIVKRVTSKKASYYMYLSTGNFHEKTAKLYSDFGLFTCDKRIIEEAKLIFNYINTKKKPKQDFKYLGVGTFNLKQKLIKCVKKEIAYAKQGKKAKIILKMNSLQDAEMIDLLYKADQAGVVVQLIIRGICCLVPGIKGISENIKAISIVDRYLEHARVFVFNNGGDELVYLSSADWMVRNLHHRIETMFPILDPKLKKVVKDILKLQLNDNRKARLIHFKKTNQYKSGGEQKIRSQYAIHDYIKQNKN
ncbi:MAG: polyphosphate kinase 1 [Saprospiraceae bacterium]|nr:polyphosphate kinase 1 [Saprospiraceae bacterium]